MNAERSADGIHVLSSITSPRKINRRVWQAPELFGTVLPPILRQFATGLNQAFLGTLLYGCMIVLLVISHVIPVVILPTLLLWLAAWLVTLWSKQRCFSFSAPISGRFYVRLAYALDLLTFPARLMGLDGIFVLPISITSAICFVLFLNRINRLIHQPRLIVVGRSILATWSLGLVFLLFSLAIPGPLQNAQPLAVTVACVLILPLPISLIAYAALLKITANSMQELAHFLDHESVEKDHASDDGQVAD